MTERTRAKTRSGPAVLESVDIVFRILGRLAVARRALGVTEIAAMLGEPKPRVYRHLASLRQVGAVEQDPVTEKYRLGAKLAVWGAAATEQFDLRAIAAPYLGELRDATGYTVLLSTAENGTVLVVATADSLADVYVSVRPGTRPLAHCSAQGRIALAYAAPAELEQALAGKLARYTPASMTDAGAIRGRLARIRQRLYEEAAGEVTPGINALAAPIFRGEGTLVGTIGMLGTSIDLPLPATAPTVHTLQAAAAKIGRHLNNASYERVLHGPTRLAAEAT